MESVTVLLVEDNPADVRLAQEALTDSKLKIDLRVAKDGVVALEYLHREGKYRSAKRPDLILLDLNLPRKDGREVLAEVKSSETLGSIPVVVLTTSDADEDIFRSYKLQANCYVKKPVDLDKFLHVVRQIEEFWLTIVKLPTDEASRRNPKH